MALKKITEEVWLDQMGRWPSYGTNSDGWKHRYQDLGMA